MPRHLIKRALVSAKTGLAALLLIATPLVASPALADAVGDLRAGVDWFQRRNLPQAIEALTRAIESDELSEGNTVVALDVRARAYVLTGKNPLAIADVERLLEIDPDNGRALILRAGLALEQGSLDAALADVEKAIEDERLGKADRMHAALVRGRIWDAKGDFARALAESDSVLRADPNSVAALVGRGMALRGLGRFAESIAVFDRVLERDPRSGEAFFYRGQAHLLSGDFSRAVYDLNHSLVQFRPLSLVHEYRGIAQYNAGRFPEAAKDFDSAMLPQQDKHSLWVWRYLAMLRMGDTARADWELKRRLAIAPDGSDSLSWTLALFRHFGGQSKAAAVMKAARSADPERREQRICEANLYLGEFAAIGGKKDAAAAMLKQAVSACAIASVEHVTAKTSLARLAQ